MFTPFNSFIGGLLIFMSAFNLDFMNGRTLGISGIISTIFFGKLEKWRFYFILGNILAAIIMNLLNSNIINNIMFINHENIIKYIISGFLIGYGSKTGNGCTSGHMICGISRLSKRSITASICFFITGTITNYIFNKNNIENIDKFDFDKNITVLILITCFFTFYLINKFINNNKYGINLCSFFSGFYFSIGLIFSGMYNPKKVLGFLNFIYPDIWDPSLFMVILGGLLPNLLFHQFYLKNKSKPVYDVKFYLPDKKDIDIKLILGSFIFGIGWGLNGICPGPAIVLLFTKISFNIIIFWLFLLVGMFTSINIYSI